MNATISNLILPLTVLIIIIIGIIKKVDIYDTFIEGAKESFDLIISMFPCLLAMILAVNLFIRSGFLNYLSNYINPIITILRIPIEVLPMILMRPISGSSSLAILSNILSQYGPDGIIGTLASLIQGSTDTTFYVISLYFGSIGIKKIRYAMWAGILADICGIIASIVIVNIIF